MKPVSAFAILACAAPALLFADPGAPKVSGVVLAQPSSGTATVTFDLDEDAVVTAEFFADGAAVPAEYVQSLSGDVNCKVAAGSGRTFSWRADKDWPERSVAAFSVKVTAWPPLAPPDYMAVDLRAGADAPRVRYYASAGAVPGGATNRLYKSDVLLMRRIPAAMVRHRQGSPEGVVVSGHNEVPHLCTLSADYYMGVYAFTEAQNALVGGGRTSTPAFVTGDDAAYYPFTGAYWKNHIRGNVAPAAEPASGSTLAKLRTLTGISTIDLPTDAQWEYACRAGTDTTLNDGTESGYGGASIIGYNNALALAWFDGNAEGHPHEVGLKKPNAWGLYDMLGNVREWCRDGSAAYAETDDVADPLLSGSLMLRGGCWNDGTYNCTSAHRDDVHGGWSGDGKQAWYGFRVMCGIPAER